MVATVLEIDENAMLKELGKLNNLNNYSENKPIVKKLVTNSSQFEIKAQKIY